MPDRPPPLAQVSAVLRLAAPPRVAALTHVADLISACLDVSSAFSPARAAASGSPGLFKRVAHRLVDVDRVIREYEFSISLEAAIQTDDLEMVQTIHRLNPEPLAVKSFELVMVYGSLELVQWVLTHRHNRGCCSGQRANLCRLCAELALKAIGGRDAYRITLWLLTVVFETPEEPNLDLSDLLRIVRPVMVLSAKIVRLIDSKGLLTARVMADLMAETIATLNSETTEIVHYLLQRGYSPSFQSRFIEFVIQAACARNQEQLVELLLANKACESVRHEFTFAPVRVGGPKVLQWSQEFEKRSSQTRVVTARYATSLAVSSSHVDMVNTLLSTHCISLIGLPYSPSVSEDELLAMIQLLHTSRALEASIHTMDRAATNGYLQIVQWLHKNLPHGCSMRAMSGAATNGHLDVVQWLHKNRSEGNIANAMNDAASKGHIHVMEWIVGTGHQVDVNTAMMYAAANGHLDALRWLYCNVDNVCVSCVKQRLLVKASAYTPFSLHGAHPRVLYTLRWLDERGSARASGCSGACAIDGNHEVSINLAALALYASDVLLLEYLNEHHRDLFAWPPDQAEFDSIAGRGTLSGIQWLYANHPDSCNWRRLAARADHLRQRAVGIWLRRQLGFGVVDEIHQRRDSSTR